MPIVTQEKTWQRHKNQVIGGVSGLPDHRALVRAIVADLKVGCLNGGGGLNPWTVRYSCDSVAAGSAGDGVDRWDSDTDLVWHGTGASAHSWMVLRQDATGMEVLISCIGNPSYGNGLKVAISPSAGFTGGSTTADPTATDDPGAWSGPWAGGTTAGTAYRLHTWQSSDGQVTRVSVCSGGFCVGYWEFGRAKSPLAAWTTPNYGLVLHGSTIANVLTYAALNSAANVKWRHGAVSASGAFACRSALGGPVGSVQTTADDYGSKWPVDPVALFSLASGAAGGPGQVYDLWFGSTGVSSGDMFDSVGSKELVQMGVLILPAGGDTYAMA